MLDYIPFYRYSLDNARHCNEVELWRNSHKANLDCAIAIKNAVGDNFNDNHFNSDCVNAVIKEFGFDRVNFILRYNLKKAQHDTRYSAENREWGKLNLYDSSHCDDKIGVELEEKILVLNPTRLNDKYKTPEDQLFVATGGFGCSPSASGKAVYGYFLKDNEECRWDRNDFIGILKDEFLPDWAKEKLNISDDTAESVEDSGISMS